MTPQLLATIMAAAQAGMTVDTLTHVPEDLKRVYGEDFGLLQADVLDQMQNMINIDKAMTQMFDQMTTAEADAKRAEIKKLGEEGVAIVKLRGFSTQELVSFTIVTLICLCASPHKPSLSPEQFAIMKSTGAMTDLLKK